MTEGRPFTVGFAAETQDVEKYARGNLGKKESRHDLRQRCFCRRPRLQ